MMLNNLFHKFILMNLINFSIIPLFFQDLIMIWFFMEINNFLFINYLCLKLNNKKLIFLYYLIQIIASLMMIFPLILNNFFMNNMNLMMMINFYSSMMLKLGIPPFHLWMPIMSMYMNWNIIFIFLSIQKIIPFYILSMINAKNLIFYYLIISSMFISTYKMINLLNLKILLTYSSINQTGWMLLLIFLKNMFWLLYMIIYSLILFILSYFFSLMKFSLSFLINNSFSLNFNLMCLFMIMNLASIPPLSFFMMKWMNMFVSIFNLNLHLIFILMIMNSLILIYIYMNFMIMILFFYSIKSKFVIFSMNTKNKNFYTYMFMFINFLMSLFLIMI
uniref:NADH-ubiquinone oxidoreductase chain 2 n=1 Tax=Acropyga butteli TaxID=602200 RepID=A0A6G5NIA0_9HYME|nr:NADH dehydrogenase subunit 2 [Acropyga butteli]